MNAIYNLALLTGNIGREGAAPFSITGQCNAMGTREAGFTSSMPGYRKFENAKRPPRTRRTLWNIPSRAIPSQTRPGLSRHHRSRRRRKRFVRCGSSEPILWSRFPTIDMLKHALANLGFSGRAGWLPPHAHDRIGGPGISGGDLGEKEGTYTNSERRVSKVKCRNATAGRSTERLRYFSRHRGTVLAVAKKFIRAGYGRRTHSTNGGAFHRGGSVITRASAIPHLTRRAESNGHSWKARPSGRIHAALHRRTIPDRRWPRKTVADALGALSGTAEQRISAHFEYRPHGGALAHAHQNRRDPNSATHVAARLAGDEPRDAEHLKLRPHDRVEVISPRGRVAKWNCGLPKSLRRDKCFCRFIFSRAMPIK